MFKIVLLTVFCCTAFALPAPEAKADPKAKADPHILAAYTAPVVAGPAAVAYTSAAYSAPIAYSSYVAPSLYSSGYTAYDPFTGSYVLV